MARAAGVHPNTVRLYEQRGFISPAPRAANGYRVFGEKHLCQIRICRCIYDYYLGRKLRRASYNVIRAAGAWNVPLARRHAQEYLALLQHELAVARQTAGILERWAPGIGVTEEALRNWERNGLLRVPRIGPNRTRVYGEAERERLRVIYMLRQCGYSMSAIHNSLRRYDEGDAAGVIEGLGTVESVGGTWTWCRDHWAEALEGAWQGPSRSCPCWKKPIPSESELRKPSRLTPPFLLSLPWTEDFQEGPAMAWQDALLEWALRSNRLLARCERIMEAE